MVSLSPKSRKQAFVSYGIGVKGFKYMW